MWCFDPTARRQLAHSELGTTKKLKSTDSKILEMLLIHQGQVVSREQLEEVAWPGRFVSASSLTQSIAQLRLMLGDNGREQKIIQTVPTRGYRLVAEMVDMIQQPEPEPLLEIPVPTSISPSSNGISRIQWGLLILFSLLLMITAHWLAVMIYTNAKTDRAPWQQVTFQGVRYFYEPDDQGELLFESFRDTYPDNIQMLYLSKNPDQIYISCVFQSQRLKERKATNMSFGHDYSPAQIKEAVREQCQ
ncbi:winged helix-turn-helix domain-containing protein [Photobacterium chitinilyticum]|uniref:winged helix-turn-helix domain-containing protein n=1 Tax=Photobacterium chitinilyticum TaxID=2485123 RepID=UPI003D12F81E